MPVAQGEPNLDDIDEYEDISKVQRVGKEVYPNSVSLVVRSTEYESWETREAQYDLSSSFREFSAVLGLSNDSDSAAQIRFEIFTDNRTKPVDVRLGLGQTKRVKFDVSNVLRLRLVATALNDEAEKASKAVFADAEVRGVEGEIVVPEPSPES